MGDIGPDEMLALKWMEKILGHQEGSLLKDVQSKDEIGSRLRDGVHLRKLLAKLQPDLSNETIKQRADSDEECRENIRTFLDDCQLCGIENTFQIDDLLDGSDVDAVLRTVVSIKSKYCHQSGGGDAFTRGHVDTPHPFAKTEFCFNPSECGKQ